VIESPAPEAPAAEAESEVEAPAAEAEAEVEAEAEEVVEVVAEAEEIVEAEAEVEAIVEAEVEAEEIVDVEAEAEEIVEIEAQAIEAEAAEPADEAAPAPVAADRPAAKAPAGSKNGSTAPAKAKGAGAPPDGSRPRLKERYLAEYRAQLQSDLGLSNVMQVPGLEKIVINMGVGRATQQQSLIEGAQRDLLVITGQKPIVTRAKKSIAGFKLREGQAIGVKVTLRGDRAWEFFDRLVSLAIPRIRDFRGLSPRSFDGRGNYTFGVVEQLIFPEVDYDRIDTIRGMDITIVTTAHTDEHGRALLRAFGFPFRQETR
jgi:large subunit ribosomal protein L5